MTLIFERLSAGTSAGRVPALAGRDLPVDVLKGLATVLVVFGHVNRGVIEALGSAPPAALLRTIDFVLYTTHMPVFFLVAGYFTHRSLRRRTAVDYARSRLWDLAYPYLLWSLIYVAAHLTVGAVTHINHPLGHSDLTQIAWQPIHVLWFLYVLLILQLAALLLSHAPRAILVAAAVAAVILYVRPPDGMPGVVRIALVMTPFFLSGYVAAAFGRPALEPVLARPAVLAMVAAGFGIAAWIALSTGVASPVGSPTLVISALGIALCIGLTLRLARSGVARHLAWIGAASLSVYLIHVLTLALVPRMFLLLGVAPPAAVTLAVGTTVGVYGSLLLAAAIERLGLSGWLGLRPGPPWGRTRAA